MEATSKRVTNKKQHKHNKNNSKNNHLHKNESNENNKNNKGKSNKHKNKSKDNNDHDHLNNRKTCHPAQQQEEASKPKDEKENGTDVTHRRETRRCKNGKQTETKGEHREREDEKVQEHTHEEREEPPQTKEKEKEHDLAAEGEEEVEEEEEKEEEEAEKELKEEKKAEEEEAVSRFYDPLPLRILSERAAKEGLALVWKIQHDSVDTKLFYGSLDLKGQHYDVKLAEGFTKKKAVQAYLARIWLRKNPPTTPLLRKELPPRQPLPPTPFAALQTYLVKRNLTNKFYSGKKPVQAGFLFYCCLELGNGQTLTVEKGPFSDVSYAKHKAAREMLERLAGKDPEAWDALKSCLRQRVFKRGEIMEKDEDDRNEYKGAPKPNGRWDCDSLKRSMTERDRSMAVYVCGFLNAGNEGSIWYGIHDATKTIHGIQLSSKELDECKLLIQGELRRLWPPISEDSEVIDIWHELISPSSTDKYYLLQVEVRPGVRLGQTTWAKKMVWQKRGNMLIALEPEEIVQRLHKQWTKEE